MAMASIASLYFHQKKFEEAEEWNKKLISVRPEVTRKPTTLLA